MELKNKCYGLETLASRLVLPFLKNCILWATKTKHPDELFLELGSELLYH